MVFTGDSLARMEEALAAQYPAGFLDAPEGRQIADAEINQRHYWFRQRYVPWLESVALLEGRSILEVGTGNGSSCVAMAESGASVDGVDINPAGPVARLRAQLLGVADQVSFHDCNGTEIAERFAGRAFDTIAFMASLEHMTLDERLVSLRAAWSLLVPNGLLVIADTPNRLWFHDDHIAFENFFHWLPEDVALRWGKRSTNRDLAADLEFDDAALRLARRGRGVSYHDVVLALGDGALSTYVSGEWEYRRTVDEGYATWWAGTPDGRYHQLLREIAPELPMGFLEPELAVCLRKPA